jgi:prepilin-type N-terminal cleavage/methylation domain-containing protein
MANAHQRGFTLIEALIAVTLLAGAVGTLLHVATRVAYQGLHAGQRQVALTLAQSKLEELLALPFRFDAAGQRQSHPDLAPSDAASLQSDAPPHVDALDRFGLMVDAGDVGVYTRRWNIATAGDDTLHLSVCVTTATLAPLCVWATRVRTP